MANTYHLGTLVRVATRNATGDTPPGEDGRFKSVETGAAIDPSAINLTITTPAGVETVYVYGVDAIVVKDAVGAYHADIDANAGGWWVYRWWSTGSGQAGHANTFFIRDKRGQS